MNAVIYRRQSLDANNDQLGIARQLKECKRVAKAKSLTVTEVITDNCVSASKRGRPGYDRLVKMMATGQVDTVIILRIDRLLRLNDELEELIQLVEKHPVRVVTAEGDVDLSTPQGRLVARILVSVARSEMEVKSARHKLANRQRAEAGQPHGSRRAFGYEADNITIRESEAQVLRDVARRFLNGWSYRSLSQYLNDQGITTAEGCKFFPITVRNMLMRKRYAAIREYQGQEFKGAWTPIFDRDTWERIQFKVRGRQEAAGNKAVTRKYLLTGYLFCGVCGGQLNGEKKRDHPSRPLRDTYTCRASHCVIRGAVPLEHFIRELIVYRLSTPDMARLLEKAKSSANVGELLERKRAATEKLDSLVDDYSDGTLTKAEYIRAKERTKARLEAVDSELAAVYQTDTLGGLVGTSDALRERWNDESHAWRRHVISQLIERVVVNKGITKPFYMADGKRYRFDTELIDVVWRV